ncbi:plexin-A4-like [Tropilaelaps mercedesae]|uniref:Plexin-A4-like n=1 Tax=Tropilaelaps mercedesae TaxID=418985 RepID=A0A1V9XHM4_9ACAR|nr:plexin-A4-like [Tropilaelaps mercedesae]
MRRPDEVLDSNRPLRGANRSGGVCNDAALRIESARAASVAERLAFPREEQTSPLCQEGVVTPGSRGRRHFLRGLNSDAAEGQHRHRVGGLNEGRSGNHDEIHQRLQAEADDASWRTAGRWRGGDVLHHQDAQVLSRLGAGPGTSELRIGGSVIGADRVAEQGRADGSWSPVRRNCTGGPVNGRGTEGPMRDGGAGGSIAGRPSAPTLQSLALSRTRRWRLPRLLLLPLLVMLTHDLAGVEGAPKKHSHDKVKYISFTDPTTERFIHQTMCEHTGNIYVGAVNKIYQLDENLELQSVAVMGPQGDHPWCPVTRQCPTIQKKPLDYYNKVLVIDYVNSRLISCGSLFQGVCSVHRLDNVADFRTPAHESVVANNATASTVGFIGKGPNNQRVLYVGVSYTNNGPYRSDVPAVSSRSLDLNNNTFNIAVTGVSTGTRVSVNSLAREFFPIHYVFGFTSKDFSYLLTVQKKETDRPYPYISKLVRVCQRDVHYYSYTEVALVCRTPEGITYNLAQAAYVGKPGSELAVSLGISAQDDVLFVVFAKSANETDDSHNKPTRKSALCVYALSAVHRKFTQNIHHCFNGHGQRGLDFINPSQPCQLTAPECRSGAAQPDLTRTHRCAAQFRPRQTRASITLSAYVGVVARRSLTPSRASDVTTRQVRLVPLSSRRSRYVSGDCIEQRRLCRAKRVRPREVRI